MTGREELGERLSAYLDGEVTPTERAELEALLASDAEARALLAELRAAQSAVAELPRASAPVEVLAAITARLERQALLGPEEEQAALVRTRPRPWRAWGAVAALVAVAVSAALYVTRPASDARRVAMSHEERADQPLQAPAGGIGTLSTEDSAETRLRDLGEALDRAIFQKETDVPAPPEPAVTGLEALAYADRAKASVPPTGEPAEIGRQMVDEAMAAARAPTPPPDWRTLEQKLSAGEALATLAQHRFENEPLQMRVEFAAPTQQAQFERELRAVLARYRVAPVLHLGQSAAPVEGASDKAKDATVPEDSAANALVYFEGNPMSNYAPVVPGQEQLLVRLPPDALPEVMAVATSNSVNLALQVGGLQARGAEASNSLALQMIEPALPDATSDGMLAAADTYDAASAAAETAADVFELLSQLGFPVAAFEAIAPETPAEPAGEPTELAAAESPPRAAPMTRQPTRPRGGAVHDEERREQEESQEEFVGPPPPSTEGSDATSALASMGKKQEAPAAQATASGPESAAPRGPLSGGYAMGGSGGMTPPAFARQGLGMDGPRVYARDSSVREPLTLVIDMRPVSPASAPASTNGAAAAPEPD
jgi:hypothetical protein